MKIGLSHGISLQVDDMEFLGSIQVKFDGISHWGMFSTVTALEPHVTA